MEALSHPLVLFGAAAGILVGIILLARGFAAFNAAARVEDTAASRISSIAVGEVLVSGVVEPAEMLLVSPLQSAQCVYYRSRVGRDANEFEILASSDNEVFAEERAVGFRVRDDSGTVRVFPRGARFDVPMRFDEQSTWSGSPPGLQVRTGPAVAPTVTDREAAIARLLEVRPAASLDPELPAGWTDNAHHFSEARIEPGEVVTVVGRAMPFDQLPDPVSADLADGHGPLADPEVAADLAAARASGRLAGSPEEAWGNAAIPGFGIGRPTRAPVLDAAANALPIATADEAESAARTFDIAHDDLILAGSPEVQLQVALGAPAAVSERHQSTFLVGLLGAVLAIGSAMVLAIGVNGGLGS